MHSDAIALSFTTLVVANLGLIFANRSWTRTIWSTLRTPNAALWWVIGGTTFFLGLALYVPFLRDLFHFSTLHPDDLALCLAGGVREHSLVRGAEAVQAEVVGLNRPKRQWRTTDGGTNGSSQESPIYVSRMVLNRRALPTTETELKLMAAAAIIGLRRR